MNSCDCFQAPTRDETLAAETVDARPWIHVQIRTCAACAWSWSWIVGKTVRR